MKMTMGANMNLATISAIKPMHTTMSVANHVCVITSAINQMCITTSGG
jgi:hypothetical protein